MLTQIINENCCEVISAAEMLAIVLLKLMQQKYRMCDYYCTQYLVASCRNKCTNAVFFIIIIISRTFVEFIFFINYARRYYYCVTKLLIFFVATCLYERFD